MVVPVITSDRSDKIPAVLEEFGESPAERRRSVGSFRSWGETSGGFLERFTRASNQFPSGPFSICDGGGDGDKGGSGGSGAGDG